jgi:hypothetical protein
MGSETLSQLVLFHQYGTPLLSGAPWGTSARWLEALHAAHQVKHLHPGTIFDTRSGVGNAVHFLPLHERQADMRILESMSWKEKVG